MGAFADLQPAAHRLRNEALGGLDCVLYGFPKSEIGRDRGGKHTACPVSIGGWDAFRAEITEHRSIEQDVQSVAALHMTAFHEHAPGTQVADTTRSIFHTGLVA